MRPAPLPALAPLSGPPRSFLEVRSKDARRPLEVASAIDAAFGAEVATVLPVPFAIPALAPQTTQPTLEITHSPDFQGLQLYARAPPDGLGFSEVARLPGADGAGVTVIDLEGGWMLAHEALRQVRFNVWTGAPSTTSGWVQHGTAVSSLLLAPLTGFGIAGLVPAARGALASIFAGDPARQVIAPQVDACRAFLGPGDVLLVEVQRPGPATDFEDDDSQRGYLATSFWPDVKESIRACVAAGITVVEVGGNGGVDLGDPSLQGAFDQTGSTLTALGPGDGRHHGRGRPPPIGTQPARARLDFSNYGDRVDCQAWGDAVVSAGYGDLWGGMGSTASYTRHFMGTSSAGPLVAAAAVAIPGPPSAQVRPAHPPAEPAPRFLPPTAHRKRPGMPSGSDRSQTSSTSSGGWTFCDAALPDQDHPFATGTAARHGRVGNRDAENSARAPSRAGLARGCRPDAPGGDAKERPA